MSYLQFYEEDFHVAVSPKVKEWYKIKCKKHPQIKLFVHETTLLKQKETPQNLCSLHFSEVENSKKEGENSANVQENYIVDKEIEFENNKQEKIVHEPIEKVHQSDVEILHKELIKMLKKRNDFEQKYNQNAENYGFVFVDKEKASLYETLRTEQHEKNHKSCIEYKNIIESCKNKSHQTVRSKIGEHGFISNCSLFKNAADCFVYEPFVSSKINTEWKTWPCFLDIYLDGDELSSDELFETEKERQIKRNIIVILKDLKLHIAKFLKTKILDSKNFNATLAALKKQQKRVPDYVFSSLVSEMLSPITSNEVFIDPVVVCTIVFTGIIHDPFLVYFENHKYDDDFEKVKKYRVCYNAETLNFCIKTMKHLLEFSNRAAQKFLFIDSGVASLFWNIVFYDFNFKNFDINDPVPLAFLCPTNMFCFDSEYCYGIETDSEPFYNKNRLFVVFDTFGDVDFLKLLSVDENSCDFYNTLCKMYIIMSRFGFGRHTCNENSADYLKCISKFYNNPAKFHKEIEKIFL